MFIGDELPNSNDEQTDEEDLNVKESDSEEGEDVVVFDEDNDTYEELGKHTIHFKVLRVTYQGRQNYTECAKQLISYGNEVPVSLVIEEDTPVEPDSTAVMFDTGIEHIENVCVGYIQKEFKDCMTRYLQHNKISKIQLIKQIKLSKFLAMFVCPR